MRNTAAIFRAMDRLQDAMLHATMPRLAAKEVPAFTQPQRLVRPQPAPRPLTVTLAEVGRA